MDELSLVLILALVLALGGVLGFLFHQRKMKDLVGLHREEVDVIRKEAEAEALKIRQDARVQAQEEVYQIRREADRELRDKRAELQQIEKRLLQKEEQMDRKENLLSNKDLELHERQKELGISEKRLQEREKELDGLVASQSAMLERISGMSREEAKDYLLTNLESEVRHEAGKLLKKIETETKEEADKKAKEIISLAISRYAGEYVAEKTVSAVALPSDEMKGRIIGREGRNIRALEAATGMDLIIDDTPEAVIISGFNPVRREVARIALERLVADGRIHPARIEEIVRKAEKEVDAAIKEAGEQAAFDVGVHGIHPEVIKLLGKLRYRTSYAQNVLLHSIEVAFLSGVMASELRLNVKRAKRAGLLHDIGKAVDHEVEGPHALIGADLAKKYGEHAEIIHAIAAHHEDVRPESVLAVIVQAADALSGARPGARRELLESYVKRLEDIEAIAMSLPGVQKSYAIQAGREIRIIVNSEKVSDEEMAHICRNAVKRIESELSYPGQIRVTVIRETRAVDYAK